MAEAKVSPATATALSSKASSYPCLYLLTGFYAVKFASPVYGV